MGGRGSTKTSKNALKIGFHVINEDKCSVIVLRRYQNSLRNSVYKEVKRALKRLGLEENIDYKANVSPMEITILQNGNKIYFAGGDDYEKVKRFIDENTPIKILWFEELTEFDNEEDLQQIIATFSRGNNDWFISMYSYNPPKNKFDWVNKWSEDMSKRQGTLVTQTDYRTVPNEWLGRLFIEEAERLKFYDEKRYNWIYLGEIIGIEGLIYNPDHIIKKNLNYLSENKVKIMYVDFVVDGRTSDICNHMPSNRIWHRWELVFTRHILL
jgi:PBSX family phage terminase large subunit